MTAKTVRNSILILSVVAGMASAPRAASAAEDIVVVRAGTVITVTGREIPRGDIVIIDGKIDLIGTNLEFPKTATVIDARDRVVMPGMINAQTRYGLRGFARSGNNSGEAAADEIELSLMDFEPLLSEGFVTAAFIPTGNNMPGRASVYRLAGPNGPELLERSAYVPISMTNPGSDKGQLQAAIRQAEAEIAKAKKAREDFDKKQAEEAAKKKAEEEKKNSEGQQAAQDGGRGNGSGNPGENKPAEFQPPDIPANLRFFVDVLREEATIPAVFELSGGSDYIHLVDALGDKAKLFGATFSFTTTSGDFKEVVQRMAEQEAHVIIRPSISFLPFTTIRYSLPAELEALGCTITTVPPFDSEGGYEIMRTRMADLIRTGWSRESALQSVTLNPAKLLGLDEESGSIEKGKRADLIFLNGDPLDPTSSVKAVMINGQMVWEDDK